MLPVEKMEKRKANKGYTETDGCFIEFAKCRLEKERLSFSHCFYVMEKVF